MTWSARLLATLCVACWSAASATLAAAPAGLRLVWADEFDAEGPPDPSKWVFEEGFVRNQELQWYQEQNATCRDGRLVIEARRETFANPRHDPEAGGWKRQRPVVNYTSSCLKSEGKFSWQYGVMEVRARIDARAGLWPAIWTLGVSRPWPRCGEVDLMEYQQGDLLANAAWKATREQEKEREWVAWDASRQPVEALGASDWARDFHLWRMEWTPDQIVLSVDGKTLNEVDIAAVPSPGGGPNPFRQPHFILLNLAIGSSGGDPSETRFPATFEVDYVRVYQP